MQISNSTHLGQYKSKHNEIFDLSWRKWQEPLEADYRMYYINAHHKKWGDHEYKVFVTKKSYLKEEDATYLIINYILDEVKKRLDMATDGKHLLVWTPMNHEGWALI